MKILEELIKGILLILPGFIFTFLVVMLYECKIRQLLKRQRNKVHFYVARDKSDSLYLYLGKPERLNSCFVSSGGTCCGPLMIGDLHFKDFGINLDDFKDLKWEDEPIEVFLNLED